MSYVSVYVIDKDGELAQVAAAPNSHAFHMAIWHHLARLHGYSKGRYVSNEEVDKLWAATAKLPRAEGLLLGATYDRCWFPKTMQTELVDALRKAEAFAPTAQAVAAAVKAIVFDGSDRGFTFAASVSGSWSCPKTADYHILDSVGHLCSMCNEKIQRADHMLDALSCCGEGLSSEPIKLRMKVWTSADGKRWMLGGALTSREALRLRQPLKAYAMRDADVVLIELTHAEYNALPFSRFEETDRNVPSPGERSLNEVKL